MDQIINVDPNSMNMSDNEEKFKNLIQSNTNPSSNLPKNFISIIRLKPLSLIESKKGRRMVKIIDNKTLKVNELQFNFDYIFPENSSQETVFSTCINPYLDMCYEGYNLNIFTIGQTVIL
jgi:kinesin family protein 18/19